MHYGDGSDVKLGFISGLFGFFLKMFWIPSLMDAKAFLIALLTAFFCGMAGIAGKYAFKYFAIRYAKWRYRK